MSLLAYIWQTIMRKPTSGVHFSGFSPLGLPYISEISLYFPANGQTKTYDVG